jgi:hypothetical protein
VQHNARRVHHDVEAGAADHGDQVTPSTVADGEDDLDEQASGEEGEEEGVARE